MTRIILILNQIFVLKKIKSFWSEKDDILTLLFRLSSRKKLKFWASRKCNDLRKRIDVSNFKIHITLTELLVKLFQVNYIKSNKIGKYLLMMLFIFKYDIILISKTLFIIICYNFYFYFSKNKKI